MTFIVTFLNKTFKTQLPLHHAALHLLYPEQHSHITGFTASRPSLDLSLIRIPRFATFGESLGKG